jgi:uncharacterized membrane protein YvlD (DUF360 family)
MAIAGRARISDLARMFFAWAISTVALVLAAELVPGLQAESTGWLFVAAGVTGAFGAIVRPVLVEVVATIGWWAVATMAVCGQAVIMHLALMVVPGVVTPSFWTLVAVTWVAAAVSTALTWVVTAGTDEAFVAALRRYSGKQAQVTDPEVDGVLFVQLDGVAFPVAHWALESGVMPTLRRWVDGGSHRLLEWTVQLPCTTPASQLGILHGSCAGVPAFRWYDRQLGRLVVANRPADAALIESRASTGTGLLSDDGVSVSNLFSGDAGRSSMTMSKVGLTRGSRSTRKVVGRFTLRPDGFLRSLTRTSAEIVKERFQASQQRRRRVVPRVHRSWTFAALRAITNGVLRDLNTAIVTDEMMRGAHSIYVDYVDYDEVAHHAGLNRLESLKVLQSLDQVLSVLERVAEHAPRRYRIVVLSDHGQAQGEPFAARYGSTLGELCAELTKVDVASVGQAVESWGRVESLFDDLSDDASRGSKAAESAATRMRDRATRSEEGSAQADLVALGSGNLGLVYAKEPARLVLEDLEQRWPLLVPGLAAHPGIGFVAGMSRESGPVVIGSEGVHHLRSRRITGTDPLSGFGAHAPRVLAEALERAEAPELYVNSTVNASTLEVAAFEDLLGCHGGLGAWQDRGMLMMPTEFAPDGAPVEGAERVHVLLVTMLERLGHRRGPRPSPEAPAGAAVHTS